MPLRPGRGHVADRMKKSWKLALAVLAATTALSAGPAQAGWRDDLGVFRIGVVAEPGAGQSVRGLSKIRDAFAGVLTMPVEVFVARDLLALIEA
jgi:phosphonate transport system substrate-binding protein